MGNVGHFRSGNGSGWVGGGGCSAHSEPVSIKAFLEEGGFKLEEIGENVGKIQRTHL